MVAEIYLVWASMLNKRRSIDLEEGAKRNSIAGGVSIVFAWRLIDRLIALISTPILARLLTPDDFGVVALSSIAAGLIGVFLDFGVQGALIQQRNPTPAHYDTAWTIRILQATTASMVILLASWSSAAYFSEPRLVSVLHIIALTTLIGGFENIGIVLFQKNFQFQRELRFMLTRRVIAFFATIAFAVVFRTYWALVLGALCGQAAGVLLSFVMHEYRPRFDLSKAKEIFTFSQWVMVRGVGAYALVSLPMALLGRRSGTAEVGVYRAGNDIANLGIGELIAPLSRVLYPAFVEARESPMNFRRAVLLAISVQFLITIPACVGLAVVAEDAVAVFLGHQWGAATPVVAMVALSGLFIVFQHTGAYALMATGGIRVQALMMWAEALVFLFTAIAFVGDAGASGIAATKLVTSTAFSLAFGALLTRPDVGISLRELVGAVWRPLLSSACMAGLLAGCGDFGLSDPFFRLLVKIGVGVCAYCLAAYIFWVVSGRQSGAEAYVLDSGRRLLDARLIKKGFRSGAESARSRK